MRRRRCDRAPRRPPCPAGVGSGTVPAVQGGVRVRAAGVCARVGAAGALESRISWVKAGALLACPPPPPPLAQRKVAWVAAWKAAVAACGGCSKGERGACRNAESRGSADSILIGAHEENRDALALGSFDALIQVGGSESLAHVVLPVGDNEENGDDLGLELPHLARHSAVEAGKAALQRVQAFHKGVEPDA